MTATTNLPISRPDERTEDVRLAAALDELDAARTKIENLTIALTSSRIIGTALGVLVERFKVTPDDAFALLVGVSQRTHRKLRDIANDLVYCGALPDLEQRSGEAAR